MTRNAKIKAQQIKEEYITCELLEKNIDVQPGLQEVARNLEILVATIAGVKRRILAEIDGN